MRAMVLVRHGAPETAFEERELPDPTPGDGEVRIAVQGFGLNYADCMARVGLYRDAPPLPSVLGYEVVGQVESVGPNVDRVKEGDRVVAFTRFGGYATRAVSDQSAVAKLPADLPWDEALGLPTQFGTAYFCAEEMVRLHEGDRVMIQAAAGGVGNGLVQLALRRGCEVFGTAGSEEKLEFLRELGVHHPINYREHRFADVVRPLVGDDGIDVAFDSVGGKSAADAWKLLGHGGRLVCYGVASQSGSGPALFRTLRMATGFPYPHPISMLLGSRGLIGVNMLRIGDAKPRALARTLEAVVALAASGELKVTVGGRYAASQLAEAHAFLAGRQSIGKVVVEW